MKEPKELGIKIGTKSEAAWKEILNAQEKSLVNSQINQAIAEAVIKVAQEKIKAEKGKLLKD